MTLRPHHARHALVIALGMALAACGSDATNPNNSATGVDTGSQTNKLGTKAPAGASGPIYKDAETGALHLRGDLLAQALLSKLGERDASGQPLLNWLDADKKVVWSGSPGGSGDREETTELTGPALLLKENISADTANTGLGQHIYEVAIMEGAILEAPHLSSVKRPDQPAIKFGVSLPGMNKKGGASQPVTAPLEIGQTLNMQYEEAPDFRQYQPTKPLEMTLTSETASTIQPNEYYTDWTHTWRPDPDSEHVRTYHSVNLTFLQDDQNDRRFSTCIDFKKAYNKSQRVCDDWEVPTDWRAGQALVHLGQDLREHTSSEMAETAFTYTWNDKKGTAPVPEGVKTTADPINRQGISGALLAAMFDAWTPRARGMESLPPFASLAKGPQDTEPGVRERPDSDDPDRISVYHESRATAYADGGTDAGTYSPASGSYLYAFRSGTWKSADEPRSATRAFNQITMAMHMNQDPAKGFTLPRWAGVNQLGEDFQGEQYWLYQGEQLADGAAAKTVAPNDLLLFGHTVQYWYDPSKYSSDQPDTGDPSQVLLILSVEKSVNDERSADLCWTTTVMMGGRTYKHCTTWQVPEGWAPGQALKPQSYYTATANDWTRPHWNTRVAQ